MSQAATTIPIPIAARRGGNLGDTIFAWACKGSGVLVLALLGAIIVELFIAGLPAFRAFGPSFVWSTS